MIVMNSRRVLVHILRDICAECEIEIQTFSSDWIIRLSKAGRHQHIFGYDFPLNNAAAQMIAKDKAATAELLEANGVPCVRHHIFHGPQLEGYVPLEGNWRAILELFARYQKDVVCKRNEGTGGSDVYRARTINELEVAAQRLFQKSRSICVSPYLPIDNEFRTVVLNGQAELVYAKKRPALWGDGASTIHQLALSLLSTCEPADLRFTWPLLTDSDIDSEKILGPGEPFYLNWKHNLGQGSQADLLTSNGEGTDQVTNLALSAAEAIDISFASIDIVEVSGSLSVLEVNSGIMMESLARQHGHEHARRIYDKAVRLMFGLY